MADVYQFVISHSQEAARLPTDEIGQIGVSTYWFYTAYDSIIEGEETIKDAGERLIKTVLDTASGTLTKVETLKYTEPIQCYLQDAPY